MQPAPLMATAPAREQHHQIDVGPSVSRQGHRPPGRQQQQPGAYRTIPPRQKRVGPQGGRHSVQKPVALVDIGVNRRQAVSFCCQSGFLIFASIAMCAAISSGKA
ncbi:MAG: hypothetical protein WDO70_11020 [Alphaproteobacteria bacterium]